MMADVKATLATATIQASTEIHVFFFQCTSGAATAAQRPDVVQEQVFPDCFFLLTNELSNVQIPT